jgi:hypothetical protein
MIVAVVAIFRARLGTELPPIHADEARELARGELVECAEESVAPARRRQPPQVGLQQTAVLRSDRADQHGSAVRQPEAA